MFGIHDRLLSRLTVVKGVGLVCLWLFLVFSKLRHSQLGFGIRAGLFLVSVVCLVCFGLW